MEIKDLTEEEYTELSSLLNNFRERKERERKTIHLNMTRFYLNEELNLVPDPGHGTKYENRISFWGKNWDDDNHTIYPEDCIIYDDVTLHDTLAPMDENGYKWPELYVIGENFTEQSLIKIKNKLLEFRILGLKAQQKRNIQQNELLNEDIIKAQNLIK